MSAQDGGPAFPQWGPERPTVPEGMSLLDYMAGQAMIALILVNETRPAGEGMPPDVIADVAEDYAVAMIHKRAAREAMA